MKIETLEEVAKNYANYNEQINKAVQEAVKFGYKLGQKKSYSEDEILEIIRITKRDEHLTVNQIFQKVKKIQK